MLYILLLLNEIPYVELDYGTYEVYRVEISKQTYKGELNQFLFDRYICESLAFTDISEPVELKLFYNKEDGPKVKGTQNRKQTAIYWSLLWGVCVLEILNITTSLKNKEVGLFSICASLNIE